MGISALDESSAAQLKPGEEDEQKNYLAENDLDNQRGSYDALSYEIHWSLNLKSEEVVVNVIRYGNNYGNGILNQANQQVTFEPPPGRKYRLEVSADYQSKRLILNGIVCFEIRPPPPNRWNCRSYHDIVLTSW